MSKGLMRRITKLKATKEKVAVNWIMLRANEDAEPDEYSLSCKEAPLPSMLESLQQLRGHVIDICEMGKVSENLIEIIGVSFSWTNDVMGATITSKRKLTKSTTPLILNTPHKPERPYAEGGDKSNVLSDEAGEKLRDVLSEAEKYIDGERAQTD